MSMPLANTNHPEFDQTQVKVLLPLPLPGPYDYLVPPEMEPAPGMVVEVPLSGRTVVGVIWDEPETPASESVDRSKLREIVGPLETPPLDQPMRRFVDWVANYTLTPPGAVLRLVLRVPGALSPPAPRTAYELAGAPPDKMTRARERVIGCLADGPARTIRDLAETAGVSQSVIKGLIAAGTLGPVTLPPWPDFPRPDFAKSGPALSAEQQTAAEAVWSAPDYPSFDVALLDGVTGSGKTEVYFTLLARLLSAGGQAVVLLPEIALTTQWLNRFEDRFGVRPAQWHSDLTPRERQRTWRAVAEGVAAVVVGARSALFLPFADLRLIVIDEEHDASFKQEDGALYHARDMAIVRASLADIPIVLASATPSLETLNNVRDGRYRRMILPARFAGASLPAIEAIDLRENPPAAQTWISPPLRQAIEETLEAGNQTLLFLNRRGYAPLTLCGNCGYRLACPNCTAWLVEHRLAERLQCHHCGYQIRPPTACPECHSERSFRACGPGVERLTEEVAHLYPTARLAVMSSDTVHGPTAAAELVRAMVDRELDILIGTQVVAKGHHFPNLTLVGVIDADLGLAGGDLRAAERTYQLLSQVSGRAGRAALDGRVMLQTSDPDHPVIRALLSADRDGFVSAELAAREAAKMPPFARLAGLILSGPDQDAVAATARRLAGAAPIKAGCRVLGPAPAPLAILRGRYRYRLLIKADKSLNLQTILRHWLKQIRPPSNVRIQVDVDPYSFL